MFSKYPKKSVAKSIEDFDHLAIDPMHQTCIMQIYERNKAWIGLFHKGYFILQREHALAKEKLRYQQELLIRLRQKYDKMLENEVIKESIKKMCRDRITLEEFLLEEYRKKYERVTKENGPFETLLSQSRARVEGIVAREVSIFEQLKEEQRIVMYLASVTKEEVQAVGRSRLQKTFQLFDEMQKREAQKSRSIQ